MLGSVLWVLLRNKMERLWFLIFLWFSFFSCLSKRKRKMNVLAGFVCQLDKLESSERKEFQLRKCLHETQL